MDIPPKINNIHNKNENPHYNSLIINLHNPYQGFQNPSPKENKIKY